MKKAYGYIRVSTDEQQQSGLSIEAQQTRIEAYCVANDLELVGGCADSATGKNVERPGLRKIRELARGKVIDAVVVLKLDRLARNTRDTLDLAEEFDKFGVALHSISEKVDTKSPMGNFFFTMTAAYAQMERELISERTVIALDAKRARGEITGAAPFGWMRESPESQKLVVNPDEQAIVNHIMSMRSGGKGPTEIAGALNRMGRRTRSGGEFTRSGVWNIMKSVESRKTLQQQSN